MPETPRRCPWQLHTEGLPNAKTLSVNAASPQRRKRETKVGFCIALPALIIFQHFVCGRNVTGTALMLLSHLLMFSFLAITRVDIVLFF